jgi:hypothetical protein
MTSAAFELHQTRDFTQKETGALNRQFNALLWPAPVRWRFRLPRYVTGLGVVACISIRRQMSRHYCKQRLRRPTFAAGDGYRLDEARLHHVRPGISFTCPLLGVKKMVNDERYITALLADDYGLLLAKAAFADQDVEGFCAELERRWKAACAIS